MKAREEMPLLRCALGPTGRPFGDGLHSVTASGTDGRKAVITRNWDMAGSTLKKPIRGRKMGVGAKAKLLLDEAAKLFPGDSMIHYNLACYNAQLGQLDAAQEHLDKSYELGDAKQIKLMALDDEDLKPLW